MEYGTSYKIDDSMSAEEVTKRHDYALAALGHRIFKTLDLDRQYSITLTKEERAPLHGQYREVIIRAYVESR